MQFKPNQVAFGRHESFALRFGWLTKGFQEFEHNKGIFSADDAVVRLGVGKNMVNSIRHWLRAAQLIVIGPDKKETTPLGEFLFSEKAGKDPYLEDEATIWLLHWLLATNPEHATSWYWFFNLFHKPEFTSQEVANALVDFAKENIKAKFSVLSVKNDCAVLLRTYVQSKSNMKTPVEEALDSPLSLLRLITYSPATKSYQSRLERRDSLPLGVLGFAIADLFQKRSISEIPIEDLMYGGNGNIAPGILFRLTENALLAKVEQLINYLPGIFKLDETAGIHQLYRLQEVEPIRYLEKHYNALQQHDKAA
ncbi:hypothetical protein GF1_16070 [Desulfolithobacter dissulfuricans]|uniref:DUF4007 domain-containing protein n=1 Tax=Desulfolithobacter dissulfuricans TaxID=2795293 RepID=A0A915U9S5_9BACT|nr:DUF4007 family protein [Desulfolithobacter dissulfuricans]BCO09231.1 hypothetical protein GF1_16070 [Desulfolithobacter dissulfuricans]